MSGVTQGRSIRYATLDDPVSATFLADTTTDIQRELDTLDGLKATAMKRPIAMMRVNSFTVPVSTLTTVNFTIEDVDTHAMINLGTNAQRITVSSQSGTGLYQVFAYCNGFATSTWTLGEFTLRKNGTGFVRKKYYNFAGTAGSSIRAQVSSIVYLGTVGDYVDLQIYHEGGGTDNVSTTTLKAFKISN